MLTVIRLGETIGAKLTLNEKPSGDLWLGVKVGDGQQLNFRITGQQTELKPECDLSLNDNIGAILLNADGTVFAYGGAKEKVSSALIKEYQAKLNAPPEPVVKPIENTPVQEQKKVEEPVSTPQRPQPQQRPFSSGTATKILSEPLPRSEPERPAEPEAKPSSEPEFSQKNEVDSVDWQPQEGDRKKRNPFDIPKAKNFYQAVRGRLEEIMTINPKEVDLERLIPDSEWVKVRYDGEEYYVVGRMYENNLVTYLGYGVPGVESVRPPKEAEELCDFLPIKNDVGYWLMFQKADDGSITREIQ
jgi:hypothetical protein